MKVFNADGSVLMEVQSLERNGNNIEFEGMVMGATPVKGWLTLAEARGIFKFLKPSLWLFLLTFLFQSIIEAARPFEHRT